MLTWHSPRIKLNMSQLCGNDLAKYGRMALGIEFAAREMHFYKISEVVYMRKSFPGTDTMGNNLVDTYVVLLEYLVEAKRYFKTGTISMFICMSPISLRC
jgi:hypothetical protein